MTVRLLGILVVVGLLAVVGIPLLVSLFRFFLGDRHGGGISRGHADLTCPHCRRETPAGPPTCEHCGCDL